MLLKGIIESSAIPIVDYHRDAGEGLTLLLPALVHLLLHFPVVLTRFPNKGGSEGREANIPSSGLGVFKLEETTIKSAATHTRVTTSTHIVRTTFAHSGVITSTILI